MEKIYFLPKSKKHDGNRMGGCWEGCVWCGKDLKFENKSDYHKQGLFMFGMYSTGVSNNHAWLLCSKECKKAMNSIVRSCTFCHKTCYTDKMRTRIGFYWVAPNVNMQPVKKECTNYFCSQKCDNAAKDGRVLK